MDTLLKVLMRATISLRLQGCWQPRSILRAVPMPQVCILPKILHFSQSTQFMMREMLWMQSWICLTLGLQVPKKRTASLCCNSSVALMRTSTSRRMAVALRSSLMLSERMVQLLMSSPATSLRAFASISQRKSRLLMRSGCSSTLFWYSEWLKTKAGCGRIRSKPAAGGAQRAERCVEMLVWRPLMMRQSTCSSSHMAWQWSLPPKQFSSQMSCQMAELLQLVQAYTLVKMSKYSPWSFSSSSTCQIHSLPPIRCSPHSSTPCPREATWSMLDQIEGMSFSSHRHTRHDEDLQSLPVKAIGHSWFTFKRIMRKNLVCTSQCKWAAVSTCNSLKRSTSGGLRRPMKKQARQQSTTDASVTTQRILIYYTCSISAFCTLIQKVQICQQGQRQQQMPQMSRMSQSLTYLYFSLAFFKDRQLIRAQSVILTLIFCIGDCFLNVCGSIVGMS